MASSSSSSNPNTHITNNNVSSQPPSLSAPFDPTLSTNTTFVQADPSTFRSVVQRLTGAPLDPSTPKLPLSLPIGPRRSSFKLHERRQTARKLEIKLNNNNNNINCVDSVTAGSTRQRSGLGFGGEMMVMVSPVSTLDFFARGSPRTPSEEEEKAIAEKGFYFHPSPLSTPRGGSEPELLPLFPLHSPRHDSSSS
ncbi:VQ motif-containing protein 11-like [Camellia sinensis]|uniref:VQ domain-containing protein n=2 Tax=Camellia sinensis TaxID=4442 RepID=A0A7J7FXG0_CAMSI|nr:VQ motif-containing protein 11-like [Camellia sinensis]KAF5932298.1 hypothetical protein HYC85_028469 [Camellia sinensis]THG12987.1 hypothetical protein TEA_027134 [Camellia sinensis var. sinensis]